MKSAARRAYGMVQGMGWDGMCGGGDASLRTAESSQGAYTLPGSAYAAAYLLVPDSGALTHLKQFDKTLNQIELRLCEDSLCGIGSGHRVVRAC